MKLVEIIRGLATSQDTYQLTEGLSQQFPLERQSFILTALQTRLDRALDEANGLARFVGRDELAGMWARSTASKEQLVHRLEDWCQRAEASGIAALVIHGRTRADFYEGEAEYETIAAIHGAGGLAVIPHPMSYLTRSVGQRALERLLALGDPEVALDELVLAVVSSSAEACWGWKPRTPSKAWASKPTWSNSRPS